ncbi:hypothetical protein LOTGIDRAFT_166945 [Lottia gigantea]|uniref:Uncharacterized protein n=1 Tax=Lottia gigantea TaxID=225164 RepID=V3Z750_LOTGI|nr:hypothetical protein LOTGIDRAFT_166945 [Lottia gigantea]ESO86673.1 hypothetical protein LOTGIDRAFT_166945 [Lottia gigantea]
MARSSAVNTERRALPFTNADAFCWDAQTVSCCCTTLGTIGLDLQMVGVQGINKIKSDLFTFWPSVFLYFIKTPREKEDKATLKKSLKDGKLADIKDALASYRRHDVEEEEIVTEATEIIHFLQVKEDLWDAMLRRHKGILEQAIAAAEALESPNRIMSLLTRAKEILKRLEQQDQVKVLVMKQTTISELHKYNHPKQVVHDVMMATYSLLGEKIAYLDDWEMIQSLTRKTGRCGLLRKIREFDFSKTNKAAYSFAKEKIDKYEERVVRLASGGAGTFYKWCKFTLNQIAVSREDLHNDFTYDEESEISK